MPDLSLALDTPDLAHHYERVSADRQFLAGKNLVAKLGIRQGHSVLDVGSGTGLLAEHVARIVGVGGHVVGIDPLALRIEIAQRKAKPNLLFKVGDAYALREFRDQSFDVVYLNAVFHWLPEKLSPLREFHRVLQTGGRLGITTGSKNHPNTVRLARAAVLSREPYVRYPEIQGALGHHVGVEELKGLLLQAGFTPQSIELEENVTHHPTADAAIEFSQASSFGNYLGHLPESLRAAARREIGLELERYATPEGIRQEGARIVAVAVKNTPSSQ
jgi:arsenite methyltransferase